MPAFIPTTYKENEIQEVLKEIAENRKELKQLEEWKISEKIQELRNNIASKVFKLVSLVQENIKEKALL